MPVCAACDATFEGSLNYSTDSCADLIDQSSPTSTGFGFVFTSTNSWQFFARNAETGQWESGGVATNDGSGTYSFSASDVISGDPDDCDNGDQDLGNLTLTLTFSDAGP